MTDIAHTAATIIARARDEYSSAAAFDMMIGAEGIAPYGELYNETYALANEAYGLVKPGAGTDELEARKTRAAELWARVLPELEKYAADCKAARYTGWSRESGGPVRRLG